MPALSFNYTQLMQCAKMIWLCIEDCCVNVLTFNKISRPLQSYCSLHCLLQCEGSLAHLRSHLGSPESK